MSDKTELLPTPSPVYPCANKSCGEVHSWPADDLAWSPLQKGWFCCECWDREEHGEPGISLEKELARHRPDPALRVALEEALKIVRGVGSLPPWKIGDFLTKSLSASPTGEPTPAEIEASLDRFAEAGKEAWAKVPESAKKLIRQVEPFTEVIAYGTEFNGQVSTTGFLTKEQWEAIRDAQKDGERLEALVAALRKINSEFRPHHIAVLEKYENAGTEALEDPAFVEACALEQVHEIASDALGEERWYEADAARSRGEGKAS